MMETVALPLFPLNAVLFPGGALPLKIFEQRYVEMTKRCVRDGSGFGVCLIREGAEVGEPALPAAIGCSAFIAQWELPHPNLFHLLARGARRFRVVQTEVAALGLIMAEVELLPDEADPGPPDPLCRDILEQLIERIGAERFSDGVRLDDAAWVGYRLAEILPLSAQARQHLLEQDSAQARLAALRAILSTAGAKGQD
jgi:Lon protease-like protein